MKIPAATNPNRAITENSQELSHHGYCERLDSGLLAEPLNLFSNILFVLAALIIWRRLRNGKFEFLQFWDFYLLSVVLFSVAVGSALWHSLAQPWALYLDLASITLTINILLVSSLVRIFHLSSSTLLLVFLAYQSINIGLISYFPADTLNGTLFYLATLILLGLMTITMYRNALSCRRRYAITFVFLIIAITVRGLDLTLCQWFPWGTHFLWHGLAALIFYLLIAELLTQGKHNTTRT